MTAGGGFRHTHDRNKLILAGIALSAFLYGPYPHHPAAGRRSCLRHLLLAGRRSVPRPLAGCLAALAGGGHCSPCRVAAGESTEPAQPQRQHRPYAGSEPDEATFGHQYVSAASGWCVRQRGRSGGVYRSAGATSGALLGRLRSAQRTASEHAAGGHADAAGRCTRTRTGLPRRSARRRSAGADWQPLLCLACEEARMKIALVIFITLALAGCALLSLHMGVIPPGLCGGSTSYAVTARDGAAAAGLCGRHGGVDIAEDAGKDPPADEAGAHRRGAFCMLGQPDGLSDALAPAGCEQRPAVADRQLMGP
uniref:Uncharacterized protein n=1 Tax=Panagrolaimus superbus TaxID=310955 RepID=A0A914ZCV0_9BILA